MTALASGTAHALPADMKKALASDARLHAVWQGLTPLARNEWICWTISVKKPETRVKHVNEMLDKLRRGSRRPCCWIGCVHRTDKKPSPSVRAILGKKRGSRVTR